MTKRILLMSPPEHIARCRSLLRTLAPAYTVISATTPTEADAHQTSEFSIYIVHNEFENGLAYLEAAQQGPQPQVWLLCSDSYDPHLDAAAQAAGAAAYFDAVTVHELDAVRRLQNLLDHSDDAPPTPIRVNSDQSMEKLKGTLRTMFRLVPDALIVLFDHDLRFVMVDGGGMAIYEELKSSDIEGRYLHEMMPPDQLSPMRARWEATLRGETGQLVYEFNKRVYKAYYQPILDESGAVWLGMGIVYDITDLQSPEALSNTVLAHLMDQASHQLMTPLAGLRTGLYLLDRAGDDDTRQAYTQRLEHQLNRLENVIRHLLTLNHLQHNHRAELLPHPISLNAIARTALRVPGVQLHALHEAIILSLDPDMPSVMADPDYLQMAVVELLDNALLYTPAGGRIQMVTGWHAKAAWLSISDTGIGIPAADLTRVCHHFYRAENARQHAPDHAGLGLSLAHKIVKRMGGALHLESERGTHATITLPLA